MPWRTRDWTRFVEIEVGLYADRLAVISPGSLTNAMTIEKMGIAD